MDDLTPEEKVDRILALQGVRPAWDVRKLVDRGWIATYQELFGPSFVEALADHHVEAIEWHWDSRLAFLKNEHPEFLAYFPIWSRGHLKSSIAERMVVVDAVMSVAYKAPGYALYISKNKDKVQEHIANIERLLAEPGVVKWCPALSQPQRTEVTNQQRRWTSSFLKTQANYAIQGGTLDSGLAGSRVGETRPTIIIPDDIDGREDSPVIAEARFQQLTTEILPMRQNNTLVFFAQNLISRYSVMYRIFKGKAKVLTNRKPTEIVPAVRNLVTRQETVNGIVKDVYVSGQPTWHIWDAKRIQDEIDTEGLESFRKECLHEVEEDRSGLIFYNYDDSVHVISQAEFDFVFGKNAWVRWRKKPGNDWARTKTDKHANVAAWMTISDEGTPRPGMTFIMHPMSFPANTAPEDVAERLISCLSPYAYDRKTWGELRKETLRRLNADQYTNTVAERLAYEHGELSKIIPTYTKPMFDKFNVQQGSMSHEQDTVRAIYRGVYGMGMKGVNPKKHGGVELINRDMAVDYTEPHPFRPGQLGYSRFFIVVPDHMIVYPSDLKTDDLHDSDLWRFQFSNYRYQLPRLTVTGEVIDDPEKLYDDGPNCLQMLYVGGQLQQSFLSDEQKVERLITPQTKAAVASAVTPEQKMGATLAYEFETEYAKDVLGITDREMEDWE